MEQETNPEVPQQNLRDSLRQTFDPKFSTLGHGTSLDRAKLIAETGLQAKVPHLGTTAIPLYDDLI